MKRFHVHVAVPKLDAGIRFYSTLFGAEPSVRKIDYAKWMLDEPRLNFAISQRGAATGVNHLGFQVDSDDELEALHANLEAADASVVAEKGANCCYARSDKYWVTDPAGIAWESFHSLGSIPMFGAPRDAANGCCVADGEAAAAACCNGSESADSAIVQSACCAGATSTPRTDDASACCASEAATTVAPSTKDAKCCA
jgi:catechol 2,3-dioxygenase-like lactoylglutathione lyase family enzyme